MAAHIYDLCLSPEALKFAAAWAALDTSREVVLTRTGNRVGVSPGGCAVFRYAEFDGEEPDDDPCPQEMQLATQALIAAAEWVTAGPYMADVMLLRDNRMLLVYQGDARTGFDTGGEEASEEYLAVAPLDR